MKVDENVLKVLSETADLVNTINGGMSAAHIQEHLGDDHYLVTVKVPGVDKKSLKIEMHDGNLFIFQLMHWDEGIEIPYIVGSIPISKNVDKKSIRANYRGSNLNIVMPIDEQGSMEIDID